MSENIVASRWVDAPTFLAAFDNGSGFGCLVGEYGNPSVITGEVAESSAMPGMIRVETEHGTTYLDADDLIHAGDLT